MARALFSAVLLVLAVAQEEEHTPLHAGEDCWSSCGEQGGYCKWCGDGNACCRMGWMNYSPECKQVVSFADGYAGGFHTCVAIREVTGGDFKMGITMLGSISTVVILYYLVNYPDVDMRKYTYSILNETCAIFCAVLIYCSVNQIAEEYLLQGKSEGEVLVWRVLLYLAFYFAGYFILMKVSGLIFTSPEKQKRIAEDHDQRLITQNTLTECAILAHMAGFAGIGLWTTIQTKVYPFYTTPLYSFLVFPIAAAVYIVFIIVSSFGRDMMTRRWTESGSKEIAELAELWNESVEDAEHDCIGLFGSFLVVQSFRFAVGGHLPGEDGYEGPRLFHHTAKQAGVLYVVAGCFFAALLGFVMMKEKKELQQCTSNPSTEPLLQADAQQRVSNCKKLAPSQTAAGAAKVKAKAKAKVAARVGGVPKVTPSISGEHLSMELPLLGRRTLMSKELFKANVVKHRGIALVKSCGSMCFAWSSFYATQWLVASWRVSGRDITVVGILTAVLLSYVVFILIRVLDLAADKHLLGNIGERALRRVISAFGVLIGFGWEKSFDMSVDAVASYSASCDLVPALPAKMGLGLIGLFLIMPAWRKYIIPMSSENGYRYGFVARKVVTRMEDMLDRVEEGGASRLGEYELMLRKLAGVKGGRYFRLLVTKEEAVLRQTTPEAEDDEELIS